MYSSYVMHIEYTGLMSWKDDQRFAIYSQPLIVRLSWNLIMRRTHYARTLIVIPVLNDAHSLSILVQELAKRLIGRNVSLLIVDDGSVPPIDVSSEAGAAALPGQVITLSRTLGHQKAIAIGLAYAAADRLADVFVIMDADGEDDPKDVERLLDAIAHSSDQLSIVVAKRTKRSEGIAFRLFYQLYRFVFFLLTGHRISFGNFSAMPIGAVQRLVAMSELWMSLPGTILRRACQ